MIFDLSVRVFYRNIPIVLYFVQWFGRMICVKFIKDLIDSLVSSCV